MGEGRQDPSHPPAHRTVGRQGARKGVRALFLLEGVEQEVWVGRCFMLFSCFLVIWSCTKDPHKQASSDKNAMV